MADPGEFERLELAEAVIVEGRDDVSAVERAAKALIIPTHGYGIRQETLDIIAKAYHNQGIIIFTDPDRAGENIRRRLTELFPWAKQAFLPREEAEKAGDIGIENASPKAIKEALLLARGPASDGCCFGGMGGRLGGSEGGEKERKAPEPVTMEDMYALGLAGGSGAMEKRAAVGRVLGIGTGNARALLKKINGFGISREELAEAVKQIE